MNPRLKLAVLAALLPISGLSVADEGNKERTIDEFISIVDPTVAPKKGGWVFGATAEYWNAKSKMEWAEVIDGKVEIADKESNGTLPGFGVYASHGPWSFQYARKSGSWDTSMKWRSNIMPETFRTDYVEQEVNVRYLFGQLYALGGYVMSEANETRKISDPRYTWANGSNSLSFTTKRAGPQLGLGWIAPFSENFGTRMDVKYAAINMDTTYQSGRKISEKGGALNITQTLFYRITKNINVQGGIKYGIVSGDSESNNDIIDKGAFGMIGLVF